MTIYVKLTVTSDERQGRKLKFETKEFSPHETNDFYGRD